MSGFSELRGRRELADSRSLRRIALPVLRRLNPGDISVRHPWTGERMMLHSFNHREYWYLGFRREFDTMLAFARLIGVHDIVLDVGGHIGYTALFFAGAAREGAVHVFEPSPDNLRYIRKNIAGKSNVTLVEAALGESVGSAELFIDGLSGQNNSLDGEHYAEIQRENAFVSATQYYATVPLTTIDTYCRETRISPGFLKIDVEGFELAVLRGAAETLEEHHPVLMVEMMEQRDEVLAFLLGHGYEAFTPALTRFTSTPGGNAFFLSPAHHPERIRLFTC
jgi:FkbM family methyltransferase